MRIISVDIYSQKQNKVIDNFHVETFMYYKNEITYKRPLKENEDFRSVKWQTKKYNKDEDIELIVYYFYTFDKK